MSSSVLDLLRPRPSNPTPTSAPPQISSPPPSLLPSRSQLDLNPSGSSHRGVSPSSYPSQHGHQQPLQPNNNSSTGLRPPSPPVSHHSARSNRSFQSIKSMIVRIPILPSPYHVRISLLGGLNLGSFISLILNAVAVRDAAVMKNSGEDGADEYHPGTGLLLFTTSVALLYLPAFLILSRVQSNWIVPPLDKVWFNAIFEGFLWIMYLAGSASISSSSFSVLVRISAALGFICFVLLTFDLILMGFRTRKVWLLAKSRQEHQARLTKEEKVPSTNLNEKASVSPSNTGDLERGLSRSDPSDDLPTDVESFPRFFLQISALSNSFYPYYPFHYPSSMESTPSLIGNTYVPRSSAAWPNTLPAEVRASMEAQTWRKSPSDGFIAGKEPGVTPQGPASSATWSPRRPLAKPNEDMGEFAQWQSRNAEEGYLEELARSDLLSTGKEDEAAKQGVGVNKAGVPPSSYSRFSTYPAFSGAKQSEREEVPPSNTTSTPRLGLNLPAYGRPPTPPPQDHPNSHRLGNKPPTTNEG